MKKKRQEHCVCAHRDFLGRFTGAEVELLLSRGITSSSSLSFFFLCGSCCSIRSSKVLFANSGLVCNQTRMISKKPANSRKEKKNCATQNKTKLSLFLLSRCPVSGSFVATTKHSIDNQTRFLVD
jgi:hypothetical protein